MPPKKGVFSLRIYPLVPPNKMRFARRYKPKKTAALATIGRTYGTNVPTTSTKRSHVVSIVDVARDISNVVGAAAKADTAPTAETTRPDPNPITFLIIDISLLANKLDLFHYTPYLPVVLFRYFSKTV